MSNAQRIVDAWKNLIWGNNPEGYASLLSHAGEDYMVTDETGDGCFAYSIYDVEVWIDGYSPDTATEDYPAYQSFCDACSPEEGPALARTVYRETGKRICEDGTCMPVAMASPYDEGYHDCPCCSETIMGSDPLCDSCKAAGCEPTDRDPDAYEDCQIPRCEECAVEASYLNDAKWHSNCDDECPNAGKSWEGK